MPPPFPRTSKIDPRLVILLSMSKNNLIEQQQAEREQLKRHAHRIRTLEGRIAVATDPADLKQFRKELATLRRLRISPLTTGVCLPVAGTVGRDKWKPGKKNEIHFSALVLFDGGAQDLDGMDIVVRAQSGDVFSTWIPYSVVGALAGRPSLRYIELAHALHPDLGDVISYTHTDIASRHAAGNKGAGVVVGVIDDAIDIYHPDFRDPATRNTRILWLQDRNTSLDYDSAAINGEIQPPGATPPAVYTLVPHDPAGRSHGTGVAGCAVGNGNAFVIAGGGGGPLVPGPGAAPEAGLIFVSYVTPFPEANIGDSTDFLAAIVDVFDRVDSLPGAPPCVVNLSVSDDLGPHDGTRLLEQGIDSELLFTERAVTLSAGNSTDVDRGSHTTDTVGLHAIKTLELEYTSGSPGPVFSDAIEIWYSGANEFKVRLTIPADAVGGTPSATLPDPLIAPWLLAAPATSTTTPLSVTLAPTSVQVKLVSLLADERNGDNMIRIEIVVPPGAHVPLGIWKIELYGESVADGTVHAWVDNNNFSYHEWVTPGPVPSITLGCPSAAASAITVGSISKGGGVSADSGRGLTRLGDLKPDLCTVGESVTVPFAQSRANRAFAGSYHSDSGTSYSAPVVAGACALLFECRGLTGTWADLRGILQWQATDIGPVGPDPDSGFGSLRMTNACSDPTRPIDVWLRDAVGDPGDEPYTGESYCHSPDIVVLDRLRAPVAQPTYDPAQTYSNLVEVTVRNRGRNPARGTRVFLYWADPSTNIPYPTAWNSSGIFADDPAFVVPGNEAVVDVPAGGSVPVVFAWAPPAPFGNLAGDDHYCLLVRLEHRDDPSFVMTGGWSAINGRNNIALHNLHVQSLPPAPAPPPPTPPTPPFPPPSGGPGPAGRGVYRSKFLVVGTEGMDGLWVRCRNIIDGQVEIRLPMAALPWRDAALLDRIGSRPPYLGVRGADPLSHLTTILRAKDITERTDARGADRLDVDAGMAVFTLKGAKLVLPRLRLGRGVIMPAEIVVRTEQFGPKSGWVHVGQLSDGRRIGDVTLELRAP